MNNHLCVYSSGGLETFFDLLKVLLHRIIYSGYLLPRAGLGLSSFVVTI